MSQTRPSQDRIPKICFFAGSLGFAFLLGSVFAHWNHDYSKLISDAIRALDAKQEQQEIVSEPFPRYLWYPESRTERGVLHYDPAKCADGLTLCLSGEGSQALLLDPTGKSVHTWDVPFNRVWPDAPQIQSRTPDHVFHIRRAHVYPNGDLLALYESPVHTPYGVGLARLDRDGQVVWKLNENAHHDFSIGEDGRIFVLTHRVRHEPMSPAWDRLQLGKTK